MRRICFVILNYKCFSETKELTDSILRWDRTKTEYKIVIVDNCSTDNSYDLLFSYFHNEENVDVIRSDNNGGYSYGNNYGTKYAIDKYTPDYIAIANPDITIDEATFTGLLETFSGNDTIAMTAPVMKDIKGDYNIKSQKLPRYFDDLRACWTEKNPPSVKTDELVHVDSYPDYIITEMLPGSFFVVKTSAFVEAGLFDEGTFLFGEERIIGHRFKHKGYILVLRKDLFFIHAHGSSIRKSMDIIKTHKQIWKSRIYYQEKYNKIRPEAISFLRFNAWLYLQRLTVTMKLHDLIVRK